MAALVLRDVPSVTTRKVHSINQGREPVGASEYGPCCSRCDGARRRPEYDSQALLETVSLRDAFLSLLLSFIPCRGMTSSRYTISRY